MADIKISILEKDGEEYFGPTEYVLQPEDIPFSNDDFDASNVEEAILEAKVGEFQFTHVDCGTLETYNQVFGIDCGTFNALDLTILYNFDCGEV